MSTRGAAGVGHDCGTQAGVDSPQQEKGTNHMEKLGQPNLLGGVVRKLLTSMALGVMLLGAGAAHADVLYTYTLSNALFNDGTAATGSVTIDATTAALTTWNIVTQTQAPLTGQTYDSTSSHPYFTSSDMTLTKNDLSYYIQFALTSTEYNDLLAGASSVAFDLANSYECNDCGNFRTFTQGSFALNDPAPVPEPSTLPVVLGAVGMTGLALHRKLRHRL